MKTHTVSPLNPSPSVDSNGKSGQRVMVVVQPELTGVILRVAGERILVAWEHAALDSLTLEQWNHGTEEWYDASELALAPLPTCATDPEIFLIATLNGSITDIIPVDHFESIEEMAAFYRASGADGFRFERIAAIAE